MLVICEDLMAECVLEAAELCEVNQALSHENTDKCGGCHYWFPKLPVVELGHHSRSPPKDGFINGNSGQHHRLWTLKEQAYDRPTHIRTQPRSC